MKTESSGDWREERLYVLKTLEDLKDEQRRQIADEAFLRQGLVAKAEKDINEAHRRIRALEDSAKEESKEGSILTIKNWVMAAMLSAAGAVIFELIKWVIDRK